MPTRTTSDETFYRAMLAHDPRFDGKFFAGVKTTGIYCRPVCPANKPKRQNVEFFNDPLQAERAGYRPCLRCRPESAPLSPAWAGRSATVQRALKILDDRNLSNLKENEFADLLGVSARHLRRLFEAEIGKTPRQIFALKRLNFSRKLVLETRMPITEIAFTSGFSSVRRFNDAFLEHFARAPKKLRQRSAEKKSSPTSKLANTTLNLALAYRPPFDWPALLQFYREHCVTGVEHVTEDSYSRVFKLGPAHENATGAFRVTAHPSKPELKLELHTSHSRAIYHIVQNVRRMFDLNSDPLLITNALSGCKHMRKLATRYPGLRLPHAWDPFEAAVTAILGQFVSVTAAKKFVSQLVENYGEKTGTAFYFPAPEVLAVCDLNAVGTTNARKNSIRELSRRVSEKKISLSSTQSPEIFREELMKIKGIGPWTADYVSLRALGDTDAFPATDLILKRIMDANPNIKLEKIKPWRAYAAFYLWRDHAK